MIAVIQRVGSGEVKISGRSRGKIDIGYVIFLGVAEDDSQQDADWLADKIVGLRIFEDENEKMNLSIKEVEGKALPLYEHFMDQLWHQGIEVEKGEFGTEMQVHIMNEGPVTLVMDSKVKYPR